MVRLFDPDKANDALGRGHEEVREIRAGYLSGLVFGVDPDTLHESLSARLDTGIGPKLWFKPTVKPGRDYLNAIHWAIAAHFRDILFPHL